MRMKFPVKESNLTPSGVFPLIEETAIVTVAEPPVMKNPPPYKPEKQGKIKMC